jgi:hypothetical protein
MQQSVLSENGQQASAAGLPSVMAGDTAGPMVASFDADSDTANASDGVDSDTGSDDSGQAKDASGPSQAAGTNTFVKIKDLRSISRGKSLRLQVDDVIIAISGKPFHGDIDTFLDIMFECDPETGVLLSIWRNGVIFNVIARGPLGCTLVHAKSDLSEKVAADFKGSTIEPIENYIMFEVLRDMHRKCSVIDTRLSSMSYIFPMAWLLQNRLWEAMIATFMIYGATLSVHWVLFVIAHVLLAFYFKRAHLVLRRSFGLMRGQHMWMVVAAKSELETQKLCRKIDEKCVFSPDLVGPPASDEAPKKRRRRRNKEAKNP